MFGPLDLLFKNKRLILHGVILITLISVAIWDAQQIIRDYVKDNYFALVKFKTVNESFPFLRDQSMQVCFNYSPISNQSIFHDLWFNETAQDEANADYYNQSEAIDRFVNWTTTTDDLSIDLDALTLRDRIHASMIFGYIQSFDDLSIACILERNQNACAIVKTSYVKLQPLVKHANELEMLERAVWSHVMPRVFRPSSLISDLILPAIENSTAYKLDYFNRHSLCFDVGLSEIVNRHASTRGGFNALVAVVSDNSSVLLSENAPKPAIAIKFPRSPVNVKPQSKNSRIRLVANIANIGIYEKSSTDESCKDEPYVRLRSTTINQDAALPYFRALATECRCMPFSYRRQFRVATDRLRPRRNFTICHPQSYAVCQRRLQTAMGGDPRPTKPCIDIHNRYTVTSTRNEDNTVYVTENSSTKFYSRYLLTVQCDDLIYVIYEERFQMSPQQLVAQVGGNMGLYTGISILGLWQLVAHAFRIYQNRNCQRTNSTRKQIVAIHQHALNVMLGYFEGPMEIHLGAHSVDAPGDEHRAEISLGHGGIAESKIGQQQESWPDVVGIGESGDHPQEKEAKEKQRLDKIEHKVGKMEKVLEVVMKNMEEMRKDLLKEIRKIDEKRGLRV